MALGTYNNNNKKSGSTELTVYSNLKMNNIQSEVGKTSLSFSFWNNMLGIQFAPVNVSGDNVSYDKENSITIWLSSYKALMLSKEIERFMAGKATNVGVHTRTGIINISDGSEFGVSNPCITIRKISLEGQVTDTITYEVRTNYHYSIDNFVERGGTAPSFEKNFAYNDIELEMIKIQCEEYVKSMAMAHAYATTEIVARQLKRLDYKLNKIGEAQNISFDFNSNGGGSRGSYFDNDSSSYGGGSDNLANYDNNDIE